MHARPEIDEHERRMEQIADEQPNFPPEYGPTVQDWAVLDAKTKRRLATIETEADD